MSVRAAKPIASPDDTFSIALSLARAGFYVFPVKLVPVTKPDGSKSVDKRPQVKWLEGATTDAEQVATWWGGEHAGDWIGVHAEKSGIVVVDLDKAKGDDGRDGRENLKAAGITLPPTKLVYPTRGGGEHHVYATPKGRRLTIGRDVPVKGVDIRAGNGLMVYYGPALARRPKLAEAPDWALLDGTGGERAADGDIEKWLARTPPGEPTEAVVAARDSVTNDMNHDAMLGSVGQLVKLGSERGSGEAYKAARATYLKGRPDRARDWDNAAAGSIGKFGMPPVTFDLAPRAARRVDKSTRRKALKAARRIFRRWFGDEYDLDVLLIVLAAAAVEQLDGDPLWLLIVGGPGDGKTETGMALAGGGARIVSSIASAGALLSATSKGERSKSSSGGLLREIGPRGLMFIKDFTTLMSQNANVRAEVFAALREIYDGYWAREVGTDGGRSLTWTGRLILVAAVTTAWDAAHAAVASMGDRFALVRIDQTGRRLSAGRQALANVGSEVEMRAELSAAVGAILGSVDPQRLPKLTRREKVKVLAAADVVTRARTAVELDYQRRVVDAHAPEAPTRFAKQLGQVLRGAVAIGVDRDKALALALRVARDSMPPLRLAVLETLADHPISSTANVTRYLQKPRTTVDRVLQELHLLGLVNYEEASYNLTNDTKVSWLYSLAEDVDIDALTTSPRNPFTNITEKE